MGPRKSNGQCSSVVHRFFILTVIFLICLEQVEESVNLAEVTGAGDDSCLITLQLNDPPELPVSIGSWEEGCGLCPVGC
jgi:hypothetical protein